MLLVAAVNFPLFRAFPLLIVSALAFAEVRVGTVKVPEETTRGTQGLRYVVPNELESRLFIPFLKGREGALISVGTFRTLNDAAFGAFTRVIMLDYDEGVTEFNRANLELIASSKDRIQYLERLYLRKAPAELLQSARAGQIDGEEFLRRLWRVPRLSESVLSVPQKTMARLIPIPVKRRGPTEWLRTTLEHSIRHFAESPFRWTNSYFGNDEAFQRLKRMVAYDQITPVTGNVAGRKTIRALSKALRAEGITVSALDFSNALEYLAGGIWPEKIAAVVRNIEALPMAEGAVILSTFGVAMAGEWKLGLLAPSDNWLYFAVPAEDYVVYLKAGHFDSGVPYVELHKALAEGARDGAVRRGQLVDLVEARCNRLLAKKNPRNLSSPKSGPADQRDSFPISPDSKNYP
jgi:hypothetical protein